MRKLCARVLALVAVVSGVALASQASIELLSVHPGDHGFVWRTLSHDAPCGSYVEAVIVVDGHAIVVDTSSVCPRTGLAEVSFPSHGEFGEHANLRDSHGVLLDVVSDNYGGITETD